MDLNEAINKRRSVRIFSETPVNQDIANQLIESAILAPSACNIQGWRFIVIDDQTIKDRLVQNGASIAIKKSPIGILVLYDNRTQNFEYRDNIQSAAAGIENLLLTATHLGLGACWICHLPPKKQIKKIFSLPAAIDPIAYIILGQPKNATADMPRKYTLEQITGYNKFQGPDHDFERIPLKIPAKKILIKIYYLLPEFIKHGWLNRYVDRKFVKKFEN